MQNEADQIVNQWMAKKNQPSITSPTNGNEADQIVNRWQARQSGSAHPLDDAAIHVQNAQNNIGDQSYNGLCEGFAEEQTFGKRGLYPSAADAWNAYEQNGQATKGNIIDAPKGALVYFSADQSNNGDGHVGISDGNGNFISATSNGVQQIPINDWVKMTGQTPLGYVTP